MWKMGCYLQGHSTEVGFIQWNHNYFCVLKCWCCGNQLSLTVPVRKLEYLAVFKVKVTVTVLNFNECLPGQYLWSVQLSMVMHHWFYYMYLYMSHFCVSPFGTRSVHQHFFNGNLLYYLMSNIHIIFSFLVYITLVKNMSMNIACMMYTGTAFIPSCKSYESYEILSQKWVLRWCLICSVQSAHPRPAGTDGCGQKDAWPRSAAGSACQRGDLAEDQGKQCLHLPGGVVNLSGRWQLGSRCQGKYQNF